MSDGGVTISEVFDVPGGFVTVSGTMATFHACILSSVSHGIAPVLTSALRPCAAGISRLVPAPGEGGVGPSGDHGSLAEYARWHLLQELLKPHLLGRKTAAAAAAVRVGAHSRD